MNKRVRDIAVLGLALGMVTMFSMQAMAKTPRPIIISGSATITGSGGSTSPGECTSGYSHQCPSGACECFEITGAKVKGTLLGGDSGTGDADVTLDDGDALSTSPPLCSPAYGVAVLHLTGRLPGTETINFQGTFCLPASPNGKGSAGGAWEIFSSTINASGLGTASGQGIVDGTSVNLTLKGSITVTP